MFGDYLLVTSVYFSLFIAAIVSLYIGGGVHAKKFHISAWGRNLSINPFYVFSFLTTIAAFFGLQASMESVSLRELCVRWGFIATTIFTIYLIIFYRINKRLKDPFVFFITSAFICWFGQVIVVGLGLPVVGVTLHILEFDPQRFNITILFEAICLSVLCGVSLMRKSSLYDNHIVVGSKIQQCVATRAARIVAISMVLVGVIPYIFDRASRMMASFTFGYDSIYNNAQIMSSIPKLGSLSALSMLLIPGIFLTLVTYKSHRKVRIMCISLLAMCALSGLLVGGRIEAISIVIAFTWLYTTEIKKTNRTSLAALGWAFIIGLVILGGFDGIRDTKGRDVSDYIHTTVNSAQNIGVTINSMVAEFGFNIFSLEKVMDRTPSVDRYLYGQSYAEAVLKVIPFSNKVFDTQNKFLGEELKENLNRHLGPGYSISAEAYRNYGWFGIFSIAAIGILLRILFRNNSKTTEEKSIRNGFVAVAIFICLSWPRESLQFDIQTVAYVIVFPTFVIFFMQNYYTKHSKNEVDSHDASY